MPQACMPTSPKAPLPRNLMCSYVCCVCSEPAKTRIWCNLCQFVPAPTLTWQESHTAMQGSLCSRPMMASRCVAPRASPVMVARPQRVQSVEVCARVALRFQRFGRKKLPFYRLVAIESKDRRDGRPLEYLGCAGLQSASGGRCMGRLCLHATGGLGPALRG